MANPLVAQREDSTTAISGLPLLESANDLKEGIEKGDWASVAMGAVGVALDALSMAMDPFGSIPAQPATRKSPRKQPIRVDNMTKEEFEKFKPELDKMLKADKHFFWSGGHMERVPGKNNPDKYLGKGHDVYPYRRPDNVFDVTEYPRLKQDGKGDITKFHDRTDYERPFRAT